MNSINLGHMHAIYMKMKAIVGARYCANYNILINWSIYTVHVYICIYTVKLYIIISVNII